MIGNTRAGAGNPRHFPLMLEILFLNPRVHLALAIASSVAAAFFWGFVMGRSKGKHEERIHFLSMLLSAKLEELTQTETNKQDNG